MLCRFSNSSSTNDLKPGAGSTLTVAVVHNGRWLARGFSRPFSKSAALSLGIKLLKVYEVTYSRPTRINCLSLLSTSTANWEPILSGGSDVDWGSNDFGIFLRD